MTYIHHTIMFTDTIDKVYARMVTDILNTGVLKKNRTGIDTLSKFGYSFKIDLSDGFPLLTTKQIDFKNIVAENIWFLTGERHINELSKYTKIWNPWADEDGFVDADYGYNWRLHSIDQIKRVLDELKTNPMSRRMVVDAWEPEKAWVAKLPPCHYSFVFNVTPYKDKFKLNCHVTMRSGDVGLGIPYNVAGYALITHMMANNVNMAVGELSFSIVDAHIYTNHVSKLKEQVLREPYYLPELVLDPGLDITNISYQDMDKITLLNYKSHPKVSLDVAV